MSQKEKLWTARFFSLARPVVELDVRSTFERLAELSGVDLPSLRVSKPGQKRTEPLKSWDSLRSIKWREKLTISGSVQDTEFVGYLWSFPRARTPSAKLASYQSHEFSVNFPGEGSVLGQDVDAILRMLLSIAEASRCEFGVLMPLDNAMSRQVYRERGLTEGIPGVFEFMVLGPQFAESINFSALGARLGIETVMQAGGSIAVSSRVDPMTPSSQDRQTCVRDAIGEERFASTRVADTDQSGVFSLRELFRLHRRNVEADHVAALRSARRSFEFDWSGVFEEAV